MHNFVGDSLNCPVHLGFRIAPHLKEYAISNMLPWELYQLDSFLIIGNVSEYADCYLRQGAHPAWQGAGGTEFARNGSRTCFLR